MKKASLFKTASGASADRPKSGRQSIRGRISNPIPIPDPLDIAPYPTSPQKDTFDIGPPEPAPDSVPAVHTPVSAAPLPVQAEPERIERHERKESHEADIVAESESPKRQSPLRNVKTVSPAPSDPHAKEVLADKSVLDLDEDSDAESLSAASDAGNLPLQPANTAINPSATQSKATSSVPATELAAALAPAHAAQHPPISSAGVLSTGVPPSAALSARPGPSPSSISGGYSAGPSASASATNSARGSGVSPAFRRTNVSSTQRFSQLSNASGSAGTGSGISKPQRKKSTLRGALSKLFGRRKKTTGRVSTSPVGTSRVPQHRSVRSDPTILGRKAEQQPPPEPTRSTSLPITEYDRALRSHSVGPNDITAIESASHPRHVDRPSDRPNDRQGDRQSDRSSAEPDAASRKRAATASSRMLFSEQGHRITGPSSSADVLGTAGSEWTGLSPRPVSTHGRGSRLSATGLIIGGSAENSSVGLGLGVSNDEAEDIHNPEEIGRAITSDMQGGNEFGHRRRSRSLSGINDIDPEQVQGRRRSDEIRFWRESYDPAFLSPLSSAPEGDMDEVESDDEGHRKKTMGTIDDGAALSLQSFPNTPSIDQDPKQQPRTPPQPFAFGNLTTVGASSNVRITQVANMDTRISVLETRMQRMERIVDQLCHTVPGFKGPLPTFATTSDQIPRSVPSTEAAAAAAGAGAGAAPRSVPPAIYQAGLSSQQQTDSPFSNVTSSSRYSNSAHSGQQSAESDAHSHVSFGDGQTYIGSLHPPSSSASQSQSITATAGGAPSSSSLLSPSSGGFVAGGTRPTSTSTVRGVTSLPALGSIGSTGSGTAEDWAAQLESERAVRQALEVQVKKLNDRVNTLSTTMFAMVRDPTPKPRPSREALSLSTSTSSLRDRLASTPTPLKVDNTPPPSRIPKLEKKERERTKAEAAAAVAASAETETEESEGFQTPLEEARSMQMSDADYMVYSDYDENDSVSPVKENSDASNRKKKTVRTLSLGQLTLGKGTLRT